ncbi:MAG: PAS domain S-box protein, partial [Fibrobacterota bacterium]
VQDITDRKNAQEALRASEERYHSLIQTAMDGFWLSDLEGRIVEVNPAYCRMSGYPAAELVGRSIADLEISESEAEVAQHIAHLVGTGYDRFHTRHRRKDGGVLELDISVNFWPGEGGRTVAFLRDVTEQVRAETERRQLEDRLVQAQKLESIGRLAGGVAHDFNNMLGVIQGHAEMVVLGLPDESPLHAGLSTILKATRKSADLTRQLLAFARKEVVAPRVIDLNESTSGMLAMLKRIIGENVRLECAPCPGLWPILMDPSQFDQILANLCLNARDAISGEGAISIRMANRLAESDATGAGPETLIGDRVELTVSDTGCGMDPATVERIFEPFFTTKAQGKGTGLGLATVYGAVRQNGGVIEVRSQPGKGTVFVIRFPRHSREGGRDSGASTEAVSCRHETILLVEDDANLLDLTRSMLEYSGHQVIATESPAKALELAARYRESIRLLVSDVVMPGMNGRELKSRLRDVVPHLKHLYVSGYTSDIIATHGILDKGVNFLQKPFSVKELTRKVREVLDRESEPDCSME